MRSKIRILIFSFNLIFLLGIVSCNSEEDEKSSLSSQTLFTQLFATHTNINFQNKLTEGLNTNILMYEYFYNGGGVATADFNGDDLIDIYFTANMSENKFYLNNGDMRFQDITKVSNAGGRSGPWKTGVSVVDINADGKLDIYLCYSGAMPALKRTNELFINQGNDNRNIPIFKEEAERYGLASTGFSNQSYFFDADNDGDLDMLLLNHNPKNLPILNEASTAEFLKVDDPQKGLRFYLNQNGLYTDETEKSGINGSALSYGLGLGISDFNNDGYPDFYVSNDYAVPDAFYINNGDGTFQNKLENSLGHISQFSMGNDVADINNDGLYDIFTLDMLPEDNHRQKLLLSPDNFNKFDLNLRSGFYYQYMRNMLQLNNGNNTFSEIGQLAGVSNTDWSWSALLADFDNDGWKDLYISNGYFRDYTNLDFIKYMNEFSQAKGRLQREDVLEIISHMPSSNVVNYAFHNQDGLSFANKTKDWGLGKASNSNGAAYADLDNDGDLDLVVNNINEPAFIFENGSIDKHFLTINLEGKGQNTLGIGAKINIFSGGSMQSKEQHLGRGYLSSVSPIIHFGLGDLSEIDSLQIIWPSHKLETIYQIPANQNLILKEENAMGFDLIKNQLKSIFEETKAPINHVNPVVTVRDFDRQLLLINELSFSGPCLISEDINKDGFLDIFVGGAVGQAASIYLGNSNGKFKKSNQVAFEKDKFSEDSDAVFLDVNKDGFQDLYISSGGYHQFSTEDALLQDRLYLNDGLGNFSKSSTSLPSLLSSTSCVAINDINKDGLMDIFIGGKVLPGKYPLSPKSYMLINDGYGEFSISQSRNLGMINDAEWVDLDGDEIKELVVVGEWTGIQIFNSEWEDISETFFDKSYLGWWNCIETGDFNEDGKIDLILGNMGLNTQFKASEDEPVTLLYDDFDDNGTVDPIFNFFVQGKSYPYVTRDELSIQMPRLKAKFNTFSSYANAELADIFTSDEINTAEKLSANHLATTLLIQSDEGIFEPKELPIQTQFSSVHDIQISDFNKDGTLDLALFGNTSRTKLRLGKSDSNKGVLLIGKGDALYKYIEQGESGLNINEDIRSSIIIDDVLLLGINGGAVKSYKYEK